MLGLFRAQLFNHVRVTSRTLSHRSGGRIGETSVFVQNGTKILELPVVVKKVKDVFELYRRMGIKPIKDAIEPEPTDKFVLTFPAHMSEEEKEVIDGFSRCVSSASIFRLLETVPQVGKLALQIKQVDLI